MKKYIFGIGLMGLFIFQCHNVISMKPSGRIQTGKQISSDFENRSSVVHNFYENQAFVHAFVEQVDLEDISEKNMKFVNLFKRNISSESWQTLSETYKETPVFIALEEERQKKAEERHKKVDELIQYTTSRKQTYEEELRESFERLMN